MPKQFGKTELLQNWKQLKWEVHMKARTWIYAAGIRAIKTVAQTAVATIGTSAAMGDVNWALVGSTSLLAGVLSLLTSVAGLPECADNAKK